MATRDAVEHRAERAAPSQDYPVDSSDELTLMWNGVGGSTTVYTATWPRFRPSDFRKGTEHGYSRTGPSPTKILPLGMSGTTSSPGSVGSWGTERCPSAGLSRPDPAAGAAWSCRLPWVRTAGVALVADAVRDHRGGVRRPVGL